MKKAYNIVSYIITFIMLLSTYIFIIINIFKLFLSVFYSKFASCINITTLASAFIFSLYITLKYYTPATHHLFHDNTF